MPTKLKGMTSLEIAIIVAIVLVIAIAVGWYLYTTFAAAGQQSGLVVTSAVINKTDTKACLALKVTPQGAASVEITSVEVAGGSFGKDAISVNGKSQTTVTGPATVTVNLQGLNVAVGQVLTGRVVLSSGAMAPFTATVVTGNCP
jgi:uncharacterized protein (UPF0333 family)